MAVLAVVVIATVLAGAAAGVLVRSRQRASGALRRVPLPVSEGQAARRPRPR